MRHARLPLQTRAAAADPLSDPIREQAVRELSKRLSSPSPAIFG